MRMLITKVFELIVLMRVHTPCRGFISFLTLLQVRALTDNIPVILDALRMISTVVEVQVSHGFSIYLVIHCGVLFFIYLLLLFVCVRVVGGVNEF